MLLIISENDPEYAHLGLLLRLLSSKGVFFPHNLTMVTIKPMTAIAAKMTVYQYLVMKRRKVARALSDSSSLLRVSSGPSGSTWKRRGLIEVVTTTSQLTSTTQGTSTSAYDTSKHFLSYDRCHNSRPHKRNVGHTRCLRHTHVLVEKYTSTSSCKHCIVDQNIILKSKTRDLYLFSLYTICLWTQKDSPIPPQQISVPSNLSAELAYLFSSRYAKKPFSFCSQYTEQPFYHSFQLNP